MLEFRLREALEVAAEIVRDRCAETDTASPEGHAARQALDWLETLQQQQGCEHFDPAIKAPGHLTDLIELIVCG